MEVLYRRASASIRGSPAHIFTIASWARDPQPYLHPITKSLFFTIAQHCPLACAFPPSHTILRMGANARGFIDQSVPPAPLQRRTVARRPIWIAHVGTPCTSRSIPPRISRNARHDSNRRAPSCCYSNRAQRILDERSRFGRPIPPPRGARIPCRIRRHHPDMFEPQLLFRSEKSGKTFRKIVTGARATTWTRRAYSIHALANRQAIAAGTTGIQATNSHRFCNATLCGARQRCCVLDQTIDWFISSGERV